MLFSLEALRARHGDSLILHYGERDDPRVIVIDGGPSGVYRDALRPRLDELTAAIGSDGRLRIEILMVSHIDDDHIRGLVDLTQMLDEEQSTTGIPFDVRTLWHNAFDDVLGNAAQELAAGLASAPGDAEMVVASVDQGRRLRDAAAKLGWSLNEPFEGFAMAPASGRAEVELGPLTLTVVCPLRRELEALQRDWDEKLRKLRAARKAEEAAEVAAYLDRSVYNLASIVCLAEVGGKRMLLTGDARGDHILEGLREADLLEDGKLELDVLKLPHHGSDRNVEEDFFRALPARHYVVSGDGGHGNPEVETFAMLSRARADDDFTLHLTYRDCKDGVGEKLARFFAKEKEAGRSYEVAFRPEDELSLRVDLLDAVEH